jgi:hypothetical protein
MKDSINKYFENEVSQISPPPMPSFKTKKVIKPWENFLLSAMAVASMLLIYLPVSYDSQIRNLSIHPKNKEMLMENFTRVIQEADIYYLEKRGVKSE